MDKDPSGSVARIVAIGSTLSEDQRRGATDCSLPYHFMSQIVDEYPVITPGYYTYLALKSKEPEKVRVVFLYRRVKHKKDSQGKPAVESLSDLEVRKDWKLLRGPYKRRRQIV